MRSEHGGDDGAAWYEECAEEDGAEGDGCGDGEGYGEGEGECAVWDEFAGSGASGHDEYCPEESDGCADGHGAEESAPPVVDEDGIDDACAGVAGYVGSRAGEVAESWIDEWDDSSGGIVIESACGDGDEAGEAAEVAGGFGESGSVGVGGWCDDAVGAPCGVALRAGDAAVGVGWDAFDGVCAGRADAFRGDGCRELACPLRGSGIAEVPADGGGHCDHDADPPDAWEESEEDEGDEEECDDGEGVDDEEWGVEEGDASCAGEEEGGESSLEDSSLREIGCLAVGEGAG